MADLLSVVVGGVLAVGGGAVTQWYLQRLKSEQEKRTKRAGKFEDLVAGVYEYDHWLDEISRKRIWGEQREPGMSPYAKIETIVTIHFPELRESVRELRKAGLAYEKWMLEAGGKRLNKESNIAVGFEQAYQPYMNRRDGFLEQLRALGTRVTS
jgi:hypothetical protein